MPNKKEYALRYLLLRFLWNEKEHAPPNLYEEVTKTLSVDKTNNELIVTWKRNDRKFQKNYALDEFRFFIRGDRAVQGVEQSIDYQHNPRLAQEFAQEVLGLSNIKGQSKSSPLFPRFITTLVGYLGCSGLMAITGGQSFIVPAILIFSLSIVEFWFQRGRILIPLIIGSFIIVDHPFTAIVTTLIFILLQVLNPNNHLRHLIIFLVTIVLGYGLLDIIWNNTILFYDLWVVFVFVLTTIAFAVRWVVGSHFRTFPLMFPFICFGLYLDGRPLVAIVGLACASIFAVLAHIRFHLHPVQKEKTLTPNG